MTDSAHKSFWTGKVKPSQVWTRKNRDGTSIILALSANWPTSKTILYYQQNYTNYYIFFLFKSEFWCKIKALVPDAVFKMLVQLSVRVTQHIQYVWLHFEKETSPLSKESTLLFSQMIINKTHPSSECNFWDDKCASFLPRFFCKLTLFVFHSQKRDSDWCSASWPRLAAFWLTPVSFGWKRFSSAWGLVYVYN